jgi:hypothetical protein
VFFDEFDCKFEGNELGSLKYFLAPMQDGYFFHNSRAMYLGPAIFVFAGGISHSFEDFAAGKGSNFEDVKGPDFVSRLSGHINILPINVEPNCTKHIIRRAITLRGLIKKGDLTVPRPYNPRLKVANIDEDIVYAMLTVDRYRHGVRSMEAILRMCHSMDGRIEKASLPSQAQLDMHVNAEEFIIRMFRGRARRLADAQDSPADTARRAPSQSAPSTQVTASDNAAVVAKIKDDDDVNVTPSALPKTRGKRAKGAKDSKTDPLPPAASN